MFDKRNSISGLHTKKQQNCKPLPPRVQRQDAGGLTSPLQIPRQNF